MFDLKRRREAIAVLVLLLAGGAPLSGCDPGVRTVTKESIEGVRPAVLKGETQYVMINETRRIAYGVSVQGRDTLPILGSAETLATCKSGPDVLTRPAYDYPLNIALSVTGEAAPAEEDFRGKAAAATPFPALEIAIPEDQRTTVEIERFYIKYDGILTTSIEEFTGGNWTYVEGSFQIWDLKFQLQWVDVAVTVCHSQGIVI